MRHHLSRALMRQAVRLFNSEYVSREINRANRIAWLRSVNRLGDRWLLASPINKRECERRQRRASIQTPFD